jgi:hypothetical protein
MRFVPFAFALLMSCADALEPQLTGVYVLTSCGGDGFAHAPPCWHSGASTFENDVASSTMTFVGDSIFWVVNWQRVTGYPSRDSIMTTFVVGRDSSLTVNEGAWWTGQLRVQSVGGIRWKHAGVMILTHGG